MAKIWTIASGKGGVGKSSIASALAVLFVKQNKKTLLIDWDMGLRCQDLLLGLEDKLVYDLWDCANRICALQDACVPHPLVPQLYLLVGGQTCSAEDYAREDMQKMMLTLKKQYDVVLIDCPAGIGEGLMSGVRVADETLLVSTPDLTCKRSVEKAASLLYSEFRKPLGLVMNRYRWVKGKTEEETPKAFAERLDIRYYGALPESGQLFADQQQRRTMADSRDKALRLALAGVARRMQGIPSDEVGGPWWTRLFGGRRD